MAAGWPAAGWAAGRESCEASQNCFYSSTAAALFSGLRPAGWSEEDKSKNETQRRTDFNGKLPSE